MNFRTIGYLNKINILLYLIIEWHDAKKRKDPSARAWQNFAISPAQPLKNLSGGQRSGST